MSSDDHRFSLSPEKYLEKHSVLIYIEDAVAQLLEHKDSNPKVNVTKFFSDYFTSVKEGNHVMFREFAFVRVTPHNRESFVRTFWKCFRSIGRKGDLLSVREYHSLLCLLCPDFPFAPVQKTARIVLMEDAMDCLISFTDFLYAFQVQFCYDEFLSKCAEAYKDLQKNPQAHDTVVVPTSEENAAPVHKNSAPAKTSTEGVEATHFFRSLIPVCEKLDANVPPLTILREILTTAERVTFYGFLMALAKCESLNQSIGKLPCKAELLDISDPELTSPVTSQGVQNSDILGRFPTPPPVRPGSSMTSRPASTQHRPLSATSSTNVTSAGSTNSLTGKPPTHSSASIGSSSGSSRSTLGGSTTVPIKHAHTASRALRRKPSTDSDDDSNMSATDTN